VLHPAAHDEPEIRLPTYRSVFEGARGIVYWTETEQRFATRMFPATAPAPQLVLGLGVEPDDGDPVAARRAVGLDDEPFLLCLGRTLEAKGTTMLARFFTAMHRRDGARPRLVFAGPVVDPPPRLPDVIVAGPVDDATKWGLLRAATALVSPSPYESLSIVLLEAWSVGTPVLVNGACAVTVEQCVRSGGGVWFSDFHAFETAVERLTERADLRDRLGASGRAYVQGRFTWPEVVGRYTRFLERLAT
jgi:glycosyltransferase involved in cell wall biosynthesis